MRKGKEEQPKSFNHTPNYLIDQLELLEKPKGPFIEEEPSIDRATCFSTIIRYREKGILTQEQENRIQQILKDYSDKGDIF